MKVAGMLVVPLRGVNYGFWYDLINSLQNRRYIFCVLQASEGERGARITRDGLARNLLRVTRALRSPRDGLRSLESAKKLRLFCRLVN